MMEARKDEIGRKFLLNAHISADECNELELQELIFLIHSGRSFKEKRTLPEEHLDERIKVLFQVLKDKMRKSETLYIAYEKNTNYPYIDNDDRIWLFSKKEYAAHAEDYFLQQFLMLEMRRLDRNELGKMLGMLHIWGLRNLLIDNGQYHLVVDRDDLLPPPDWSGTPKINIPLTNPDLQHAMIRFFQCMGSRTNGEGKQSLLKSLEARMLDEVVRAKYLVPMQVKEQEPSAADDQGMKALKKGTILQFAALNGEGESVWLPVFTDWMEFDKAYDQKLWSGNVATYDDILALSASMTGIIINFKGIPLQLNDKNKRMIEDFRREQNDVRTGSPGETAGPENNGSKPEPVSTETNEPNETKPKDKAPFYKKKRYGLW